MKSIDVRNISEIRTKVTVLEAIFNHLSTSEICNVIAKMMYHNEDIEYILRHPNFDGVDKKDKENLLSISCSAGSNKIINTLIGLGVDVNANDGEPLSEAISNGNWDTTYILIDNGAVITESNKWVLTELIRTDKIDLIRNILERLKRRALIDDEIADWFCENNYIDALYYFGRIVKYPIKENYERLYSIAEKKGISKEFSECMETFLKI